MCLKLSSPEPHRILHSAVTRTQSTPTCVGQLRVEDRRRQGFIHQSLLENYS